MTSFTPKLSLPSLNRRLLRSPAWDWLRWGRIPIAVIVAGTQGVPGWHDRQPQPEWEALHNIGLYDVLPRTQNPPSPSRSTYRPGDVGPVLFPAALGY